MTLGSRAASQEEAMPFQLDVALKRAANGEWHLILDLNIKPGDWVVSSYSTDSMFGKFALCFQEPQALTLLGAMEEIPLAMNFDPEATVDNDTCEFELIDDCPSDVDGSGHVNVNDLSAFLPDYGSFCE